MRWAAPRLAGWGSGVAHRRRYGRALPAQTCLDCLELGCREPRLLSDQRAGSGALEAGHGNGKAFQRAGKEAGEGKGRVWPFSCPFPVLAHRGRRPASSGYHFPDSRGCFLPGHLVETRGGRRGPGPCVRRQVFLLAPLILGETTWKECPRLSEMT